MVLTYQLIAGLSGSGLATKLQAWTGFSDNKHANPLRG